VFDDVEVGRVRGRLRYRDAPGWVGHGRHDLRTGRRPTRKYVPFIQSDRLYIVRTVFKQFRCGIVHQSRSVDVDLSGAGRFDDEGDFLRISVGSEVRYQRRIATQRKAEVGVCGVVQRDVPFHHLPEQEDFA